MSLAGFQSAVATLIRRPPTNRGDTLAVLFADFDLTDLERHHLNQMAQIAELNKYSEELCDRRWASIEKHLLRTAKFIAQDLLKDLWLMGYEPLAMRIPGDIAGASAFSLGFLDFLQHDPKARAAIAKESPEFIWDLMAYERAEIEVSAVAPLGLPLAADAAPRHNRFRVLHLSHDISPLATANLKDQKGKRKLPQVEAREVWYVVVKEERFKWPRLFEVDEPLATALQSQLLQTGEKWPESLDKEVLRQMGL